MPRCVKTLILILGLSSLNGLYAKQQIQEDKAMHFGIAAGAHSGCYAVASAVTQSKWVSQVGCFVAVNTAGLLKELGDQGNGGTQEFGDVYANMAGSGLSMAVISVAF